MAWITIFGLIIGVGGILLGNILEGGHTAALVQGTAGLIVLGGTVGAVLVSTTLADMRLGLKLLGEAFREGGDSENLALIKELIEAAQIARKESILALERRLEGFSNPFTKNVFRFVIDGVDANTLRDIFEVDLDKEEERLLAGAKVWSDAGGFSPTIGIIGAVLGLIHVMSNLTDTSKLGAGIAVAFVATVYGIGLSNLILIPLGNKIKRKVQLKMIQKYMILEGAIGILNGLNPFIIEEKLKSFLYQKPPSDRA